MGYPPGRVPLPPVDAPLLALNELVFPATIVLLVNALWLATRLMMSSGAMTYQIRHEVRQPVQRSSSEESTDLGLSEDWQKDIRSVVFGTPWSNKKQRIHSVKRRGLNKHGDDSLVQPSESTWRTHGSANFPVVQDEPGDDQEGEENVERN